MDIKKELKNVYLLYLEWKYDEANKLNNSILEIDSNNVYAKKYVLLLVSKVNNKWWFDKTARVKWKSLKCPHCLAKIPFSGLTEKQRSEIKLKNYNNLELKCPYCHTQFVLQKRKANSILGLKIWDIATVEWKKYRATWYVQYKWFWYEGNYSEWTKYLEWLLLWENNEYKYFSEWSSSDDWIWTNEFELSEKYIPKQIWKIDYIRKRAEIDWQNLYAKEIDKVKVVSVYWENAKNTVVWEQVEIFDFWNIIIEKESSWWQTEAGFYKTKELSWNQAAKLFWKEYNKVSNFWNKNKWLSWGIIWWWIFIFIFGINFISLIPIEYIFWWIGIIVIWIVYYIFKDKISEKYNKAFLVLIWLPIFSFLIFQPIFNSVLENKQKINLAELNKVEKAELNFTDTSVMHGKTISSSHYDYGGTRTYYQKNTWLKFSVKTDEDKEIIKKINILQEDNEIKKMFDWDLYKLK